ncbi:MAG: thymidylate kinase [Candidatus Thermoplasmatota archaeon]|nr:thymidylate kinase [Candidatus Thermoplasmatota archaeon]
MNKGKLISIEGIDGSGRTIHSQDLKRYLEGQGYGVLAFGLQMSRLIGERITKMKKDMIFRRRTLFLSYVTDLADQMELSIRYGVESGFMAIADGYTLSLKTWGATRGLEDSWMSDVLSILPEPDIRVVLVSSPEEIMRRLISKRGFLDPLEAGMDVLTKGDVYESYRNYINVFQNTIKTSFPKEKQITTDNNFEDVRLELIRYVESKLEA